MNTLSNYKKIKALTSENERLTKEQEYLQHKVQKDIKIKRIVELEEENQKLRTEIRDLKEKLTDFGLMCKRYEGALQEIEHLSSRAL